MGLFDAFRAMGYITTNTPFSVQRRGMDTYVTVSIGKAWQMFDCAKLLLVFVGPQLEKSIRSLESYQNYTYAAAGCNIYVFHRAHQTAVWKAHKNKILQLLQFGEHILSIDSKGHLFIWLAIPSNWMEDAKPIEELHIGNSFTPSCLMHPDTYLNKVIIGSEEGRLQLWNVKSQKMLYEFKGWDSPVRTCVSSPALDVVGIGCANGRIYVHNLRYDETVVTFKHTSKGSVTALSFRSDGQALLAAGGSSGDISIWNLEKQKLQTVIKDAHDSEISSLYFFPNEPVLLSNSKDNSLKMWIFDSFDGEARLLRFRSGHSAPPTCIKYYGNGRHVLSAGQDRAFRVFSTIQDQQSRELSQHHVSKRAKKLNKKDEEVKLAPILSFDAAEIRERDWCNVVTCHLDDCAAYTWRLQNFVLGEHILKPCQDDPSPVKVCSLSACGNFAILGTLSGRIEKFNIQSGLNRGVYIDLSVGQIYAHKGAVLGLASDSTNSRLFSGGYDSIIKVWDFKAHALKSSLSVGSPIVKMSYHRGNGLLLVASDDKILRIFDLVAMRMVRSFQGHSDRITDTCFSEDGKWVLSSSMDGTVRVWDVISSKPLDAMQVDPAVTALSLSPSMDMLATCHVNHKGIYLWANRSMYCGDADYASLGSGSAIVEACLPTCSTARDDEAIEEEEAEEEITNNEIVPEVVPHQSEASDFSTPTAQITPELITLALLPKTQWQGLVHLDTIKMRNKPIQPPKKPEKAPFFLPTLPSFSGVPVFAVGSSSVVKDEKHSAVVLSTNLQSNFVHLVHLFAKDGDFSKLVEYIKSMSPSLVDAEFRMLQIVNEDGSKESRKEIGIVMDFLIKLTSSNKDFEVCQALIQLFLRIHGESIMRYPELREKVRELCIQHTLTWRRLDRLFQNARCMVSFLSNSVY